MRPCKLTIIYGNIFGELFLYSNSESSSISALVANSGFLLPALLSVSGPFETMLDDDLDVGNTRVGVRVVEVDWYATVCRVVVVLAVVVDETDGRFRRGGANGGNSSCWMFPAEDDCTDVLTGILDALWCEFNWVVPPDRRDGCELDGEWSPLPWWCKFGNGILDLTLFWLWLLLWGKFDDDGVICVVCGLRVVVVVDAGFLDNIFKKRPNSSFGLDVVEMVDITADVAVVDKFGSFTIGVVCVGRINFSPISAFA